MKVVLQCFALATGVASGGDVDNKPAGAMKFLARSTGRTGPADSEVNVLKQSPPRTHTYDAPEDFYNGRQTEFWHNSLHAFRQFPAPEALGAQDCGDAIDIAVQELASGARPREELGRIFGTCEREPTPEKLGRYAQGAVAGIAMENYPYAHTLVRAMSARPARLACQRFSAAFQALHQTGDDSAAGVGGSLARALLGGLDAVVEVYVGGLPCKSTDKEMFPNEAVDAVSVAGAELKEWLRTDDRGEREVLQVLGRQSYVYRPRSAPRSGAAAVFVLHGSEALPESMFGVGLEPLADARGFLVVYPEMAQPKSDEWGGAKDLPYFAALAGRLAEADFGADPGQLFVCGHSAGGTMVTYLQNQVDLFAAAGVVEAAVGKLSDWDMSRRGHRTLIVWNHADPVLREYSPHGGEPGYYNLTVSTLRRGASTVPAEARKLPLSSVTRQAELLTFPEEPGAPELQIVSWTSQPGQHRWAQRDWTGSVDASEQLVRFFLRKEHHVMTV